jgi:hypothetical protein
MFFLKTTRSAMRRFGKTMMQLHGGYGYVDRKLCSTQAPRFSHGDSAVTVVVIRHL